MLWILTAVGIALGLGMSLTGALLTHSNSVSQATKDGLVVGGAGLMCASAITLVVHLALLTRKNHGHAARDIKMH